MAEDNTPTNVVDDFKLSGTMGGNTTPTGVNIAYAKVEDLEQFIQFDRKAEGNVERINEIKKTILDKGYLYDTAYEGGVVFGVIIDEAGNVQIPEGNHRLQALIDVAKETGQEIYVPINPMLTSTGGGNKVQLTNSDNAYKSMKQLLTDMLERNKNFNVERTISEKLGEPGTRIVGLESYTYPGGAPGTSTNQSNIKKFFNSIGLNTITYDELPDNNIYKTGVNTFTDTPTNVVDTVGGKSIKTKTFLDDLPLIQHPETFEGEEIIDKLMERPSGQTVEEFITENNLTQREIDIINNNFDEARRIEDYLEIKEGVSPEELRISIENVGQKTPNQIVTRYIDDAYKTFDKVNFPNTALKEQALLRLNKRLLITLGTAKEWIYDPKGGGAVMGEGTKLNEYLLNVQEIFPTEQIDPAGNLINTEQKILDELGVKQLGEGSYWDNVIRGVVINAQEDLIIEGEVIPNTLQLDTPTNVVDDVTPASVVDEAVEYINNLNIDSAIKKEVKDKVIKVTGQASGGIPIPGIGQAIDLWETAVLVVGAAALAAGEIDELPKVIYNYGLDLYESILSGYNIPYQPAKRKEYTPNFERISSGLTWIDKLQPTSYVINPVIEEFQETAATTPTMEIPGFGTVPASEYYQPPVQSSPERDNINSIMTNIMTNISNAQGAYPRTARELELFGRNPIQVVPSNSDDKPEKVEYDSKEKQNLHDIYANLYTKLSNASARIE